MVRIDFFIFGYRKIIIPSDFSAEIAGMLLRAKIPSVIRGDGVLLVREKDYRTAYELLREKSGVSFSECLGIYGAFLRIKHKKALAAASIISLVTTILFSLLIWDRGE